LSKLDVSNLLESLLSSKFEVSNLLESLFDTTDMRHELLVFDFSHDLSSQHKLWRIARDSPNQLCMLLLILEISGRNQGCFT
jgi:hypothetical protein